MDSEIRCRRAPQIRAMAVRRPCQCTALAACGPAAGACASNWDGLATCRSRTAQDASAVEVNFDAHGSYEQKPGRLDGATV